MGKVHVLVVEDEAIVSMDLRYKLESLGYSVPAVVRTGEEAIDAASQLRPDVVLMDIGLSGEMDGIDAATQIRSRLDVPVVYLTAQADEATLRVYPSNLHQVLHAISDSGFLFAASHALLLVMLC